MPEHVPHTDGEILNDKKVIIHPSGLAGEPEIFEPNTRVCLPGVLGDVGGQSEAQWERRSPDTSVKSPWPRALRAMTSVIRPVTVPRARFTAPLDGSARAHVACPYHHPVDIIIMLGLMLIIDDVVSILVWTEAFVYWQSVWSRCHIRPWCSRGLSSHAWRL